MITVLTIIGCALALIPCALFLRNLSVYRVLPGLADRNETSAAISVLIPARNEEANIADALRSVLQSEGIELEVVVLDDGSTDRTAEIVRELARADPRVRIETAQPLPPGWCGKTFACYQLAGLAGHPLLVFLDADVQVTRANSLARVACLIEQSGAGFASGVPRQETRSIMERLIVPLIHFVLLGFLPIKRMRKNTDPRFAAGCGQIVAVRRDAYERAGGHAAIAGSLHDGVTLARAFRAKGLSTDLFDATDTFRCRMYRSASEVWNGFAKNAHEALASPRLIVPATLLLLGGQVLPVCLLAFASSPLPLGLAVLGTAAALLPRLAGVVRFRQSFTGALLHPLGMSVLIAIQWFAFVRSLRRRPAVWKGRAYSPAPAA